MSYKIAGLVAGPILFLIVLLFSPPDSFSTAASQLLADHADPGEAAMMAHSMKVVLALLLLMVSWWLTEAIPLPATALLPATLLPWFHLSGVSSGSIANLTFRSILLSYANPVIFLFLGGFLIAAAMQKWGLDRRITYWFLTRGGLANDTHMVLLGVMLLTAFFSMWISNTATTAMMLPIGLGIISQTGARPGDSRFGTALMLGIAWAASIGGVGTIIGTPPNGIALGVLDSTLAGSGYQRITFLDWMKFGVPYVVLFIPIAWKVLLVRFPPEEKLIAGGKELLLARRATLGPFSSGEKYTIAVFLLAALLWLTNPFWDAILPGSLAEQLSGVDEFTIGLFAGVLLFMLPVKFSEHKFALNWEDTRNIEWGVLLLFGGGIALSDAMFKTGLAAWIASSFIGMFGTFSGFLLVATVVLLVAFLTEITSNTAVTTMMVPIVISIGRSSGSDPVALAIAAAVASSMAFMLPVATPPNALVFATGYITISQMFRAGFILDILGWILTTGVLWFFGVKVFGLMTF